MLHVRHHRAAQGRALLASRAHAALVRPGAGDTLGISESDTVLPIVPMFHVNAWGLPYTCALFGSGQILAGPHLDPRSVLELLHNERVT